MHRGVQRWTVVVRPLVQRTNRQPLASAELQSGYVVNVVCRGEREAHVHALMRRLDSSNIEDSDRVEVLAVFAAERRSDGVLEPNRREAHSRARRDGSALAG